MRSQTQTFYDRPVPSKLTPVTKVVFLLGLGVLTYQSIAPYAGTPSINHLDKVQHALGYGLLTVLLAMAWPKLRLIWVGLLPAIYGAGLEVAQSLTPYGRTGSVFDAVANICGVLIIIALWVLWAKTFKRPKT